MRMIRAARHDFSLDLVRALRVLTLAALVMALALGCGSDPAPAGPVGPQGCPTGSVPLTDGSCMPVGIQGCADIFIEEDGLCHPRMAKCPAGTIPKFDEGCVPVGIQGCAEMFMEEDGLCHPSITKCPAGTIPKFDEGCVPVGIQGCAEVFMEDDGLCHPTMEKCPAGTFAVPQEGCVPIDGPDGCGTGTWGNLQEVAGVTTIWVDPSVAASGSGTMASPVRTIAEAMAMVPVGGRVALGAGVYDEAIYIDDTVTIEGRCPSMVRVQGTDTLVPYVYVVGVNAAVDVTLRSFEIGGAGIGVLAYLTNGLKIERVRVHNATGNGLLMQGSSQTSIVRSWIDSTLPRGNGTHGRGVEMTYGTQGAFLDSAIIANHDVGLLVGSANSEVTMTDSLVERTLPQQSDGMAGIGLEASMGGSLTVDNSSVIRCHAIGAHASDDTTTMNVSHSIIEGTLPAAMTGNIGFGLSFQLGATGTILDTVILDNHGAGIRSIGMGTEVTITTSLVEGTLLQQSDGQGGVGVNVSSGARLTLGESAVVANHGPGLAAFDDGTEVTADGSLVEGQGSVGLTVHLGAMVTVEGGAILTNREVGANSSDMGTGLTLAHSLVAGTLPKGGDGEAGVGVLVDLGAHATLGTNAIIANRHAGLAVQRADTEVTATANLIARTLPQESDGRFGRGVNNVDGATLVLDGNAIVENHDSGVLASAGSVLTATGNLVEGTLASLDDLAVGGGVRIQLGTQATLESNAILANRNVGLFVIGGADFFDPNFPDPTHVIATGNTIEGTLPRESDGLFGLGVVSTEAATLQLTSSLIRNNGVSAVHVAKATVAVSRSLIEIVQAGSFMLLNPTRMFEDVGDGLLATLGSTLDVTDTRIQGCVRAGVLFDDSTGTLSDVVSTDNQFGLVLQGERRPSYESGNNQFTGNTGQDILLGGDLPVPDAPTPIPNGPTPTPSP